VAVHGPLVAGWSETGDGARHAVVHDTRTGRTTDLGTLGGRRSEATAVSDRLVVGWSHTRTGARHAFVVDLGARRPVMRDLGTLGGRDSQAVAVSGRRAVGWAQNAAGTRRPFVYDTAAAGRGLRDLLPPGDVKGQASAIDGDLIVGSRGSPNRAFVYDLDDPAPAARLLPSAQPFSSAAGIDGRVIAGAQSSGQSSSPYAWVLVGDPIALRGARGEAKAVSGRVVVGKALYGSAATTLFESGAAWILPPAG
jgi:probable HAF family extracellular repeat protein